MAADYVAILAIFFEFLDVIIAKRSNFIALFFTNFKQDFVRGHSDIITTINEFRQEWFVR